MKFIVIDDNEKFTEKIYKQLVNKKDELTEQEKKNIQCNLDDNLEKFAAAIIYINPQKEEDGKKLTDDDILFININLKTDKSPRQSQGGVELLTWLRIKGVTNHCVLYSFQSMHELLNREPKHLIATSKGTSFIQLPNNFYPAEFEVMFNKRKEDESFFAEIKNLKACLKPAFNIETVRHQQANWWGIKQLWDVHDEIMHSKAQEIYPKKVNEFLSEFHSAKGVFIYGHTRDDYGEILFPKNPETIKYGEQIASIRKTLSDRKPKVLYIDDQFEDGWGEIFCKMIYGDDQIKWNMTSIKPMINNSDNVRKECKEFTNKLQKKDFDLIILDLRLAPNIDKKVRTIGEISGAILLNEIRKSLKGIPILMTTASNKAWSHEELMKLGADAYWMKEGIDNHFTTEESIKNYKKLLYLIDKTTSAEYQNLKVFAKWLKDFDFNKAWWNETSLNKWKSGEIINGKEDEIVKILYECLHSSRDYLKTFYLEKSDNVELLLVPEDNKITESFYASTIINKIGVVVEVIHDLKENDFKKFSIKRLIDDYRGDTTGANIYSDRNESSHRNFTTQKWSALKKNIVAIQEYLTTAPIMIESWKNITFDKEEKKMYEKSSMGQKKKEGK